MLRGEQLTNLLIFLFVFGNFSCKKSSNLNIVKMFVDIGKNIPFIKNNRFII
jgi:hypothetical protein